MTVRGVVLGLVVRTDREAHIPRHTLHTGVRVCRQTLMDERINNTVKQVRVSLRCAQDITGLTVVGAGFNDEAGRQLNLGQEILTLGLSPMSSSVKTWAAAKLFLLRRILRSSFG